MPGRKQLTQEQKLENTIRTKVWMHYLMRETNSTSVNQLGKVFLKAGELDDQVKAGSKWSAYASGSSSPNMDTLNRVNEKVPDSIDVYIEGSDNSFLFISLWSDLNDIHHLLSEAGLGVSHSFFWLNQLLPYGHLRQTDAAGLKAVVGGLAKLLHEDKLANKKHDFGVVPTGLAFLSGCISILRFAIERDNYHHYSFVFEIVDVIAESIENDKISTGINGCGIKTDLLSCLYSMLVNWSQYSQSGIYYRFNASFPTETEFLNKPQVFHQRYREIKYPHREDSAEYSIDELDNKMLVDNECYFETNFQAFN